MGQQQICRGVATKISKGVDCTVVRYHSTDVVRFDAYKIVLDSGGWRTATTKSRMNQASNEFGLGYDVWQSKGVWYVRHNSCTVEFYDGIVLIR